ncbi:quinone oxidoreductase-like protein 2 [Lutzomyia longipalpis]|uniref:quinone oxidoreductase-like protein 2 n=1 Tax=Lutzomyia longipalpis TaxID=7200 RepID=UPI002483DB27|nr:quinone oxidoreductase-like protein 2 [Lutzomyia longipalpis]
MFSVRKVFSPAVGGVLRQFFRCRENVRLGSTYRAAILTEFNKIPKIEMIKVQENLFPGQVKVGVHFCSLNDTDVRILEGTENVELPLVPGCEFSGEIVAVDPDNRLDFKVGDRVVALRGFHTSGGGLASEVVLSEFDCFPIGNISLKDAAILPYGHGTAMLAFSKYCPLNENDPVIVIAGPGGLGLGAIEVASSVFRAHVIGICDTQDSSILIRDEGAFQTICMSEGYAKIYRFLKNALGNRRARCIYDAVGGEALRLLEDFIDPQNGCILTAYPLFNREAFQASTPEYNVKPKDRLDRAEIDKLPPIHERIQHVDLYSYQYSDRDFFREIIEETLSLHSEDLISAHVSKIFTLDDLDDAVEFIKKKKCTGKVLIDLKEGKTKPKDDSDESDNEDKRKD